MKILLVTPYYLPDLGPSAPLFSMLCEDLTMLGNKITVLTTVPHYPSGIVHPSYQRKLHFTDIENGINVVRFWIPSGDRNNLFHRSLVFLVFQLETAIYSLFQNPDKVIISNPCLETFLPFAICKIKRKNILFCVWDVYPEIGIKTNIFKNKTVIKFIRVLEDYCLKNAKKIHVLAKEAADQLVSQHHIERNKIFILPPWVDTEWLHPMAKSDFLCGVDISGKFVILYSGNIGSSQGLVSVLDAAKLLQGNSNCLFVLIGDGSEKDKLEKKVKDDQIENVLFFPFQPRTELPNLLSAADLCLISLQPEVLDESIPSKAFPIMASGKPILAITNPKSSLWKLIEKSKSGILVPSKCINLLVENINKYSKDPKALEILGENGRKFALKNFVRQVAAETFYKQLSNI